MLRRADSIFGRKDNDATWRGHKVIGRKAKLGLASLALVSCANIALGNEAEDFSAAYKAAQEAMAAALGYPAAASTVTTHPNGMKSASMGLEAMKMLVVRQNPDGTLDYGHAGSAAEAQEFLNSAGAAKLEEQ